MLNFSPEKLFLVGVIALIVLGPNRLPQAARTLGRFTAQLRKMSASFQDEVRSSLAEPNDVISSAISEFRITDPRRSIREAVASTFAAPAPPDPAGNVQASSDPAPSAETPVAGATADVGMASPDDPSFN